MVASRMFGKGATGSLAATLRPLLFKVECIAVYWEGLPTHRVGPIQLRVQVGFFSAEFLMRRHGTLQPGDALAVIGSEFHRH